MWSSTILKAIEAAGNHSIVGAMSVNQANVAAYTPNLAAEYSDALALYPISTLNTGVGNFLWFHRLVKHRRAGHQLFDHLPVISLGFMKRIFAHLLSSELLKLKPIAQ